MSLKVVYVKWLDAQGFHNEVSRSEVDRCKGLELESVGILISEDDDVIRYAQDVHTDDGTLRDVSVIPKRYIIKRVDMEVTDAKARA